MKKPKPEKPTETNNQSSQPADKSTSEPTVNNSDELDQLADAAASSETQLVADTPSQVADESQNISTQDTSATEPSSQKDLKKPSSNFTLIERTFILMAIAAVRADPMWRNYHDPSHPDAMKDFCEPFCNAVRKKLMEDPDFKGRVTVISNAPDGKYTRPTKLSIWKIWSNLYLNACLTRPQQNLGRKKDIAAEERVKQYLLNNPDCKMSSRAIAAQTQTSHRNVIRIIRQEKLAIRKTKFKRVDESVKKRPRKSANTSMDKDE